MQRDTDSIKAGKAQVLLEQQVREVREGRPAPAQAGTAGGTPIKDNSVTSVGKELQADRYEVNTTTQPLSNFNAQDLATRPDISQQELTERVLASAGGGTKNAPAEVQQMLLNPNLSLDTPIIQDKTGLWKTIDSIESAADLPQPGQKTYALRNFLETQVQERKGRGILNPTYEPAGGPSASMTEVPENKGRFVDDFIDTNLDGGEFDDFLTGDRAARAGVEGTGGPLSETLAYTERTNKATTRVPGLVDDFQGKEGIGANRQERLLDEVVPTRIQDGQQSTGIIVNEDARQPLRLQGASTRNPKTGGLQTDDINVEGSKYIGNYEGQVEIPFFKVGKQPDIVKKDPKTGVLTKTHTGGNVSIQIGEKGDMRPVISKPGQESKIIYDLESTYDNQGQLKPSVTHDLKFSGRYQSGSDLIDFQPYMTNELVTVQKGSNKKTYKISDTQGSYGQLMRQTGVDNQGKPILTPTSVSRNDMIQRIEGIEKGWADPSNKLSYMQQTDPDSAIKPFHRTGYIAKQLDQQLQSEGVNLPVFRDPSASHRFITDLTNTTLDTEVYGSPASREGFVSPQDYKKPKVVVEGVTKQRKGLGGVHPMDMVDELETRASEGFQFGGQKADVAFHSPRVEMGYIQRDSQTGERINKRPSDVPARGKELWDVGNPAPPRINSQASIQGTPMEVLDKLNTKVDNLNKQTNKLANSLLVQSDKSARRARGRSGKGRGR